jgi:hypothetical protein
VPEQVTRAVAFGRSAAACCPCRTGIGLRSPSRKTAGTVTEFSLAAKPPDRFSMTEPMVMPLQASDMRRSGGHSGALAGSAKYPGHISLSQAAVSSSVGSGPLSRPPSSASTDPS